MLQEIYRVTEPMAQNIVEHRFPTLGSMFKAYGDPRKSQDVKNKLLVGIPVRFCLLPVSIAQRLTLNQYFLARWEEGVAGILVMLFQPVFVLSLLGLNLSLLWVWTTRRSGTTKRRINFMGVSILNLSHIAMHYSYFYCFLLSVFYL